LTVGGLSGLGVVVTGGGSGIGAALARRLAAGGARLVIGDLDAGRAARVAGDVGGLAVPGDAASQDGVARLIAAARDHLGEIDLFCANAGVGGGWGLDSPEDTWELAWQVNVMGQVRAARLLMPAWLERGRGHFLATVSAAGLLTMPGAAPYSVTKHGALAFAEWLAITYADRGITVQALCPQGVRTPMLTESGELGAAVLGPTAISAEEVAERVVEALAGDRFLILPHPEVGAYYAARAADPTAWQAGMRRMLAKVTPPPGAAAPPPSPASAGEG
jgi:NAD(P)-dependent dehydrogenase (short-subunit alcohol dehydrogenase family)